ncbi:MAG TPA: phosphatidate cytidylyltransferase [Macromonas sp.]|nr:phosphatidate cytidylyltransferase [Macromonas sp.]
MLKQRVITAVLLLAVLLPALFYRSPEPFCAVALLFIVGAGWEWARLNGLSSKVSVFAGALLGVVLALLWLGIGLPPADGLAWPWLALVWLPLAAFMLHRGVPGWAPIPRAARLLTGWCLIGLAWWAMGSARYVGASMLLSILVLVWTADIAAYFGGKAFGRRKLALSISPGKSWEGAVSGAAGVLAVAALWVYAEQQSWIAGPSLYGDLWARGPLLAVLSLLLLTGMSVAGDLIESLVKRSAGVKDSSGLLPGHGGVLDRVDALLPVLPLAMWLVTL